MTDQDSRPSGAPRVPRDTPPPSTPASAPPSPWDTPLPARETAAPDPRGETREEPQETQEPAAPPMTLRGAPATVFLLISLTAIEFLLIAIPGAREWAYDRFAFGILVDGERVLATLSYPILTHAALHGGLLHLGFNMAALAIFGPPVERSMGTLSYLAMFVIAAGAGALTHYGWLLGSLALDLGPAAPLTVLVGASGAISGVLAAEILRRSRRLAEMPVEMRRMSPAAYLRSSSITFIALNVVISLLPGFISGEAHIGGFIVGLVMAPVLMRRLSD